MLFFKIKLLQLRLGFALSVLFMIFFASFASVGFAEEEKKAAEGEGAGVTPGEEAKGGGSEGSSNSDREWAKRKTKLNVLETKRKDLTKELQRLILIKNTGGKALDEKGKPIEIMSSISESYKKLKESVSEYNTEKEELKYRFPEEGARIDRQYVPLRIQSLEQIEKETGIDGELNRTKKKIQKKYAPFVGDSLAKPLPQVAQQPEATLKNKKQEAAKEAQRIKLSQ